MIRGEYTVLTGATRVIISMTTQFILFAGSILKEGQLCVREECIQSDSWRGNNTKGIMVLIR